LKKIIFSLVLLSVFAKDSLAQTAFHKEKTDKKLQKKLENLTKNFRGEIGLFVYHLASKKTAAIYADTLFPTASLIKVPILVALCDKINRGELRLDSMLLFRDSLRYTAEHDILHGLKDMAKISLGEVLMLSITVSDNTAALWCQQLAGTGVAVNKWLANNGFQQTRVNSRTPGREQNRQQYGWGQTTPREMAELFVKIRTGQVINAMTSEHIYRFLTRIYWDGESLSQIPPYILTASKQGAVNASRSEVVLVHAPHGDYVFCVITKNQQDQTWDFDNEGFALLRNISKTLWQHFEPKSKWKTPANVKQKNWYK
jgi:beta-lactamase class A